MSIPNATREIFEKYNNIRGKEKAEFPFPYWDIVVLTASDEGQKEAYKYQIEDKLLKGEIPKGIPYLVFSDPVGPKVGCGGSTFHVISELHTQYKDELWAMKVLLINAGGQSQRLPSASVLGKIFTPLPCGNPMYQVFDLKLASYIPFIAKMKPGVFHAAADTIEVFDLGSQDSWSFTEPGFTALAHPSSLDIGATHGVYVLEDNGSSSALACMKNCLEVLQKPSIDRMYEKNAVVERKDGTKFVYTDSCFFFEHTVSKLFLEFYTKYKPLKCEIDSYGDFLQALGPNATDEYTYDTKNVSKVEPVLVETRKLIYDQLKDTRLNVLVLDESKFYHLGTTVEYIYNFCSDNILAEEMGFQRNVFVAFTPENRESSTTVISKRRKMDCEETEKFAGCVVHSRLPECESKIDRTAVVEYCDFGVPVTVKSNSILNNCAFLPSPDDDCSVPDSFTFPSRVFIHTVPIRRDGNIRTVPIVFGISDDIKKSASKKDVTELKWFEQPVVEMLTKLHWSLDSVFSGEDKCSLWNAKLFPICKDYSESFVYAYSMAHICDQHGNSNLPIDLLTCERISLCDVVVKFKDSKAILKFRNTLYEHIHAQK